jgi:hypothetical protein
MADIEIMPLGERLGDDEIAELAGALEQLGVPQLPKASEDGTTTVSEGVDDDAIGEFLDRLEVHDAACEIYLPVEFDGRVEVANVRVGSASTLIEVLEEIRDELFTGDDEEEDPDDGDFADDEAVVLEAKLRHIWRLLYHGAQAALDRHLPLHIQP